MLFSYLRHPLIVHLIFNVFFPFRIFSFIFNKSMHLYQNQEKFIVRKGKKKPVKHSKISNHIYMVYMYI